MKRVYEIAAAVSRIAGRQHAIGMRGQDELPHILGCLQNVRMRGLPAEWRAERDDRSHIAGPLSRGSHREQPAQAVPDQVNLPAGLLARPIDGVFCSLPAGATDPEVATTVHSVGP